LSVWMSIHFWDLVGVKTSHLYFLSVFWVCELCFLFILSLKRLVLRVSFTSVLPLPLSLSRPDVRTRLGIVWVPIHNLKFWAFNCAVLSPILAMIGLASRPHLKSLSLLPGALPTSEAKFFLPDLLFFLPIRLPCH
jgi:hypothetical protein